MKLFISISILLLLISGCASEIVSQKPLSSIDRDKCTFFNDKKILVRQFNHFKDETYEENPEQTLLNLDKLFYIKSIKPYGTKYLVKTPKEILKNNFVADFEFDYIFDFHFRKTPKNNFLTQTLKFLTLFIIPGTDNLQNELEVKIWDKNHKLKNIFKEENVYSYNYSSLPYYNSTSDKNDNKIEQDLILKTIGQLCKN